MKSMQRKRATVKLKPSSYQPSKAELEADVSIDATPEELRHAVMLPVKVATVRQS